MEQARALSKALLGSSYRAEIAAAIYRSDGAPVNAQGLADETGLRYPRVQQELKHLLAAGVLEPCDSESRTVDYKAVQCDYWRFCDLLLREWRSTEPDTHEEPG